MYLLKVGKVVEHSENQQVEVSCPLAWLLSRISWAGASPSLRKGKLGKNLASVWFQIRIFFISKFTRKSSAKSVHKVL